MTGQSVRAVHLGKRHKWLERRMDHLAVAKCVFEDVVRLLETLFQIAAPDTRTKSDVGSGSSLQVLEVGKSCRWFQRVVDDGSAVLCRGHFIEHRLQRIVL